MIDDPEDVFGDNVEIVRGEFGQNVLAQAVVTQVQKKQSIMRCKGLNLELPRADGTARSVNEHHPRRIGIVAHDFVVKQGG